MVEQVAQHLPQQTRCWTQRPKGTSTLSQGDIKRMHEGLRTGFPDDRGRATNMIRVAVSENEMLELAQGTAKVADRTEDRCLFIGETRVYQRQPIVALD